VPDGFHPFDVRTLLAGAGVLLSSCGAPHYTRERDGAPHATTGVVAHRDSFGAAEQPRSSAPKQSGCARNTVSAFELIQTRIDVPIPEIEDFGTGMQRFYARLDEVLGGRSRGPLRVAVYGDSNLTEDLFTGEMRRVLQGRYGDAGHGYVAVGKPWTWYRHMDVVHDLEPRAWKSYAVSTAAVSDQYYGIGGIAAESLSGRARAWVETAPPDSPVGRHAGVVEVFYLQRPKGGRFTVRADGKDLAVVETDAPTLGVGFRRFELEEGPHRIGFVADHGVRLFGVVLERKLPGVVIDSLGVGGANEVLLARMQTDGVRAALKHRPYDLVIFLTGATEDDTDAHDTALRERLLLHREALPQAALLVMSPPDYAYGGRRLPKPSKRIARLARRKQRIASDLGCAFWDFHGAMGGELSIARFADLGMAHSDLAHLNARGNAYMARRFLEAVRRGFDAHTPAACDAASRPAPH
jgi:hypothetical protein